MPEIVATYDYRDTEGRLLYQNVRLEPKDFRIRRPDGNGGWIWGRNGQEPTLYRLPELLHAPLTDWAVLTEGEKDVETLRSLGFTAATSGGAGSWQDRFAAYFKGRLVAIIGDQDEPGRRYAQQVADSLVGVAGQVRIVHLPDGCKDISDFIADHDSLETDELRIRVQSMIDEAVPFEPTARLEEAQEGESPRALPVVNASDWLTVEPPAPEQILADVFDRGDKVAVIGSSKLRKSFFLLQAAMSLAAGKNFLGWSVPKPRRVFVVQLEIQQHHFHRRVRRMAAALELTPDDLQDRLQIVNGRGMALAGAAGIEAVKQAVLPFAPDLICIDPLYKISVGVENAAEDAKTVLALFDQLAEQTGAAVLYVHHDAKGFAGDRDIRDRGAGSGVIGRDYDAAFTLTAHATEDDALVVETLLRNYRPQEPTAIAWTETDGGYRFELRPDLAAVKQTSATARQNKVKSAELHEAGLSILAGGPMDISGFKERLRQRTGIGRDQARVYTRWALTAPTDPLDVWEVRRKGEHTKYIGLPNDIASLRDKTL